MQQLSALKPKIKGRRRERRVIPFLVDQPPSFRLQDKYRIRPFSETEALNFKPKLLPPYAETLLSH